MPGWLFQVEAAAEMAVNVAAETGKFIAADVALPIVSTSAVLLSKIAIPLVWRTMQTSAAALQAMRQTAGNM
jgi:hypothetical protein